MDFSEEELLEIFKTFKYETEEHIVNINEQLLKLEKNPANMSIIAELFREAHSIKGSARMLGVSSIQKIAHKIEDILKMAKDETITVSSEIIDVLCEGIDVIGKTLEKISVKELDYTDKSIVDTAFKIDFIRDKLILNEKNSKIHSDEQAQSHISTNEIVVTDDSLHRFIKKHATLLDNKYQKDNAVNALLNLIEDELNKGLPENEKKILNKTKENLVFIKDNNILPSTEIAQIIEQSLKAVGTNLSEEKINHIINKQNSINQLLILQDESQKIFKTDIAEVTEKKANQEQNFKTTPESYIENVFKTLRVDTFKLDKLETQSEELVIQKIKNKKYLKTINELSEETDEIQKALNKALNCFNSKNEQHISEIVTSLGFLKKNLEKTNEKAKILRKTTEELKKDFASANSKLNLLVNELETTVKSIRILPLSTILHMFPRMVRDISRGQGKQVEIVITGSEAGADKTIVEEIRSPLIHIINNAIDHGIETPEERINKGKNPTGKIIFNSFNLNNNIVIEISDDGKGLDIEKIKDKAIKEKILTNKELSLMNENQIFNLIFWPGFSTASQVTNRSGRGVGLDVVYNTITQMDGKVSVFSRKDEGFKITITIPTAIASIQGLITKINNQYYGIPSGNILYVKQIRKDEIFTKEGKPHIVYLNNSLRLVNLAEVLGYSKEEKEENTKSNIIIVQSEDSLLALEAGKILGTEEIIQKKLNPPLTRVRHISGISSLPDGEICLILNINDIIKSSLSKKNKIKGQTILSLPNNQRKTYNILIVDDSYTTLTLEKNILKSAGYKVITANNGLEAMDKLTYEPVDLIITDLEMPQMDGIELIKKVREKDANIPIIVLTSHDEKLPHLYAQNFSNDIILKKEFTRNLFLQKIEENLFN